MMKELGFALLDLVGLNALFRWKNRGKIKVLLYHNITDRAEHFDNALTPEEFSRQIAYLKHCCNIIGIDQDGTWRGLSSRKVNVLISFDDGFRNNLTHALPVLQTHGVSAVFFLIAECIAQGSPPGFIRERLGEGADAPHFATLDAADVRAMLEAGMTIGSHSLAHRDHAQMDDPAMLGEAAQARAQLENEFGIDVACFAFPWGKHRAGQEQAMAGVYRRVFLTRHGFCTADDSVIPRNEVTTLAHLRVAASGALDALRGLLGKA